MMKVPIESLRGLLSQAGYLDATRLDWLKTDGSSECLVRREDEHWLGRGPNEDAAFRDALSQMLPSGLALFLLEQHLARGLTAERAGDDAETGPPERVDDGVESGFKFTSPAEARAPAPSIASSIAAPPELAVESGPEPRSPVTLGETPKPPAQPVEPARRAELEQAPAEAALFAPAVFVSPELASPGEVGEDGGAPEPPHAIEAVAPPPREATPPPPPSIEAAPERPPRARTTDALETVERLLKEIEDRLSALARMAAERQRLHMLVWICRARAIEESLPDVRDVEHAVARVARRLTEIGKMFWPGSVRALQLSARPADVRREMHATWATEPADWREATSLAVRLLDDHLAKSVEAGFDDDGWADSAARTPRPPNPDALLEEVDAELKALLGPPGDGPSGRTGDFSAAEFESLLNDARKLRWLRGAVRDDLAWGMAMGRLRRSIPGLGERSARVRDVLDPRARPPVPWAKILGERVEEPVSAASETPAKVKADLPKARETKEGLLAWLIRAFDVLNTPDLVALLVPLRAELGAFGEDTLNHPDRRVRRRLRELVKRVATAAEEEAGRSSKGGGTEPPITEAPEEPSVDEPMPIPALDALSARVRAQTRGSRALFVSNREDPELGTRLTELLGITITWCDGSLRRVQAQCQRIAQGSYDLILSATGFQVHGVDSALARAASGASIPYVRVNRGRPVACVQAIAREFGLTTTGAVPFPAAKAAGD
jgi:hypothetical protein